MPENSGPIVNPTALEPLFMLWEFPNAHRERSRHVTEVLRFAPK